MNNAILCTLIAGAIFLITSCLNSNEKENEINEITKDMVISDLDTTSIEGSIKNEVIEDSIVFEIDTALLNKPTNKETPKIKISKKVINKPPIYDKKTMVLESYKMEDFSKWESLYNKKSDTASIIEYLINVDTSLNLGVIKYTQGHEAYRKQYSSQFHQDFMLNAGIEYHTDALFLNTAWTNPIKPKNAYYIIISHKVSDFIKWVVDFDANRVNRGYIGISDVFIATHENDHYMVTIALMTDNIEICRGLFTDPQVIEVLKNASVIGELDISYWKVISN
jgi:hypothetical protein